MKKIVSLSLLFVLSFYGWSQVNIIPLPEQVEIKTGDFAFSKNGFIKDGGFSDAASFLQIQLLNKFQATWQRSDSKSSIVFEKNANLLPEEYTLVVGASGVKITAATNSGAVYGVSSLLQIINDYKIPYVSIKDKPAYAWRGFMLDESRHFFGSEKVKQLLDWMAIYKLNKFHWHLTDEPAWRLEIQRYPYLSMVGGIGEYTNPYVPAQYYNQAEVSNIVSYAAARGIEVIPEIDMPGHATAANRAYPEFSGGGTKAHPHFTFHPAKEGTYAYLTNILKEVNILFPTDKIHLGGDEVSFGSESWTNDPLVQDLKKKLNVQTNREVETYFMRRMADSVFNMGSKIVAWDEMVDVGLPKDKTLIMWWRHDQPNQLKKSLENGYSTIVCPRVPFYFDFVQEDAHKYGRKWAGGFGNLQRVYDYDLSSFSSMQKYEGQILGAQANLWTERVHNTQRLDFMVFPRIAALAETVWTKSNRKNFEEFTSRLKSHHKWYKSKNIYFHDGERPEPIVETPEVKYLDNAKE